MHAGQLGNNFHLIGCKDVKICIGFYRFLQRCFGLSHFGLCVIYPLILRNFIGPRLLLVKRCRVVYPMLDVAEMTFSRWKYFELLSCRNVSNRLFLLSRLIDLDGSSRTLI